MSIGAQPLPSVSIPVGRAERKELAEQTGLSVNTLLSRKHYAVLHLRERLRAIHDEFTRK